MDYKKIIREVPDFPKKGILFYDITTLLNNADAFNALIDDMVAKVKDLNPTKIIGIESRGFVFGAPIAIKLNKPFVPIRKPGKLPYKTINYTYDLEYGTDTVHMHEDALTADDRVVIVDDLLATGGTISASAKLVEKCHANVAALLFAIELEFLHGRKRIENYKSFSIIKY